MVAPFSGRLLAQERKDRRFEISEPCMTSIVGDVLMHQPPQPVRSGGGSDAIFTGGFKYVFGMYPRATRQFASAAVIDSSPDNLQSLPETVEALRALVLATFAERDAAVIERDTLLTQNDRLRHLLLKLGGR